MALVFSVIYFSNFFTSKLYVSSISQKTGVNPFCTIALVVEIKVNGEVRTSPQRFNV